MRRYATNSTLVLVLSITGRVKFIMSLDAVHVPSLRNCSVPIMEPLRFLQSTKKPVRMGAPDSFIQFLDGSLQAYPFTAPAVSPLTMYFWKNTNSNTIGNDPAMENAMSAP